MMQFPWSTRIIPTSYLLPAQWPQPQSDELLLAMEESDYEDKGVTQPILLTFKRSALCGPYGSASIVNDLRAKCNEIRKAGSNLIVIGKTTVENDKEEFDNDADDDDADNAEESEGDEFEQETG